MVSALLLFALTLQPCQGTFLFWREISIEQTIPVIGSTDAGLSSDAWCHNGDHTPALSYPGSSWFPGSGIYGMHWRSWKCDCGNDCPSQQPLQIAPPPRSEFSALVPRDDDHAPDGYIILSSLPGLQGEKETLPWLSNLCCKSTKRD